MEHRGRSARRGRAGRSPRREAKRETADSGTTDGRKASDTGRIDGNERTGEREGSDITVELCVRSLSPQGAVARQEAVIERLFQLETWGAIQNFSLVVWGPRFSSASAAGRTTTGRQLERRIEAFEQWVKSAEQPDELAFERREVRSLITDERYTEIVLPVLCLAVYEGEVLRCVSPWQAVGTTHSIDDCLEAIVRPGYVEGHPSVALDDRFSFDA